MKYKCKIKNPWCDKDQVLNSVEGRPKLIELGGARFAAFEYPDLFEPVVEEQIIISQWDVVETRVGNLGVVIGFRKEDEVELYIPWLSCVNLFSLGEIKLRKDKIAMAPALIKSIHGCYYLTDPIRIVKSGAPVITREVGDSFIRWPHSIASLTIEDKS